jgi:hypothetical protein
MGVVSKSVGGVPVPGGVVCEDINRGRSPAFGWLRAIAEAPLTLTTVWLQRDIVVRESDTMRELYREGPYDGITVNRPLKRIVAEINRVGLDEFVRTRRLEDQRLGPVRRSSGRMRPTRQALLFWWAWAITVRRRLRRR